MLKKIRKRNIAFFRRPLIMRKKRVKFVNSQNVKAQVLAFGREYMNPN